MSGPIHAEVLDSGVLLAEIDHPPANAYDFELLDALEELPTRSDARVVVLASRLPRIFSAGADLKAFLDLDPVRRSDLCVRCREVQAAGLVEHVGEPGEIRQQALAYAGRIASLPPEAVAAIKDAVVRGLRSSLSEGMAVELEHVRRRFRDPKTDERLRNALSRPGKEESR